jgi:hypothetical protein
VTLASVISSALHVSDFHCGTGATSGDVVFSGVFERSRLLLGIRGKHGFRCECIFFLGLTLLVLQFAVDHMLILWLWTAAVEAAVAKCCGSSVSHVEGPIPHPSGCSGRATADGSWKSAAVVAAAAAAAVVGMQPLAAACRAMHC